MREVVELFGINTARTDVDWSAVVKEQACPFLGGACYKVRKSDPTIAIGTCTVSYGQPDRKPIMICPSRLTQDSRIFIDCVSLLETQRPGDALHLIPEVAIPGGMVDYFLVLSRVGEVVDFVGIELQTLDTTGTLWPARQRLLDQFGVARVDGEPARKTYGMNWKHTAKTILVQMHHKAETFEHLGRKLVLVVEDRLLNYMATEFRFDHLHEGGRESDSVQIHAYRTGDDPANLELSLARRLSTDAEGISVSLGLQAEARVELELLTRGLRSRTSDLNRFLPAAPAPVGSPADVFGVVQTDLDE
jgi:hypothetical protein